MQRGACARAQRPDTGIRGRERDVREGGGDIGARAGLANRIALGQELIVGE
jgi:hypothetical protein